MKCPIVTEKVTSHKERVQPEDMTDLILLLCLKIVDDKEKIKMMRKSKGSFELRFWGNYMNNHLTCCR